MARLVVPSTTSHKTEALPVTLDVFRRLGFDTLDLNLHHLIEKGERVEAVAEALGANHQRLFIVSGGWCDFFDAFPEIEATFESVDRQVGLARALGVARLRLFYGRLPAAELTPRRLDVMVENLCRLSDRHPAMRFVFENHGSGAAAQPDVCRSILARVNRPNIRHNFDPINFERVGVNAMAALAELQPFVDHVHLKGLDGREFCEFGAGDVDLGPVLRALTRAGYGGAFTVEVRRPVRSHHPPVRRRFGRPAGARAAIIRPLREGSS